LLSLSALVFLSFSSSNPTGTHEQIDFAVRGHIISTTGDVPSHPYMWRGTSLLYVSFLPVFHESTLGILREAKIINIIFSALGAIWIYLFLKREYGWGAGLSGGILLICLPLFTEMSTWGLWVETLCVALSAGVLFVWQRSGKGIFLPAAIAAVGIGIKLIFLYFLLPFAAVISVKRWGVIKSARFVALALALSLPFSEGADIFSIPKAIGEPANIPGYFSERLGTLAKHSLVFGNESGTSLAWALWLFFMLAVLAIIRTGFSGKVFPFILLFLLTLSFVVAFPVANPRIISHFLIVSIPLVLVFVSASAVLLGGRLLGPAATIVFSAFLLFGTFSNIEKVRSLTLGARHLGYEAEAHVSENFISGDWTIGFFDPDRKFLFARKSFLLDYYERAEQYWRKGSNIEFLFPGKEELLSGGKKIVFIGRPPELDEAKLIELASFEEGLSRTKGIIKIFERGEAFESFSVYYVPEASKIS